MTGDSSTAGGTGAQHRRDGPAGQPDGRRLPLTGLYPWEVADALWLAANHPWLATEENPAEADRNAEPPMPAAAQQDSGRETGPHQKQEKEPRPEREQPVTAPLSPPATDDGAPPVPGTGTRDTPSRTGQPGRPRRRRRGLPSL